MRFLQANFFFKYNQKYSDCIWTFGSILLSICS